MDEDTVTEFSIGPPLFIYTAAVHACKTNEFSSARIIYPYKAVI